MIRDLRRRREGRRVRRKRRRARLTLLVTRLITLLPPRMTRLITLSSPRMTRLITLLPPRTTRLTRRLIRRTKRRRRGHLGSDSLSRALWRQILPHARRHLRLRLRLRQVRFHRVSHLKPFKKNNWSKKQLGELGVIKIDGSLIHGY